jgi:hypothetical protein
MTQTTTPRGTPGAAAAALIATLQSAIKSNPTHPQSTGYVHQLLQVAPELDCPIARIAAARFGANFTALATHKQTAATIILANVDACPVTLDRKTAKVAAAVNLAGDNVMLKRAAIAKLNALVLAAIAPPVRPAEPGMNVTVKSPTPAN